MNKTTYLKSLIYENNNEVINIINTAYFNYKIWWIFVGPDRPKYVDVLNRYLLYFSPSIQSYFMTLIISLYKLYDKTKHTKNIKYIFNYLENNELLSNEEFSSIKDRYKKALIIWKKIKILRDNYFAHLNIEAYPHKIFSEAKITPNEFIELITLSIEIVNIIRNHFNNPNIYFVTPEQDVYKLLNDLNIINKLG